MRFRKEKGKKKAVITMTEQDIMEACHKFLENKGYKLGSLSWLKIPLKESIDKLGRKRRRGIEYSIEMADEIKNAPKIFSL